MHHKNFGTICSDVCYRRAELKYAALILGVDEAVLEKERGKREAKEDHTARVPPTSKDGG